MNETILRMVKTYKNFVAGDNDDFDYTPTKRAASPTSSTDNENTPIFKKFKGDTNITSPGSPKEFRRLKCDLVESRNYAKELEGKLLQLRGSLKEKQALHEMLTKQVKSQVERQQTQIKDLQFQLNEYKDRSMEATNQLNEVNAEYAQYKIDKDTYIHNLESKLNDKDESEYEIADTSSKLKELKRKYEEQTMIYKAAKEEAEEYKKFVDDLTRQLNNKVSLENELEIKTQALVKAQQQIKKMEFGKETLQSQQQLAESQVQKIVNYESLQREVTQLREENINLRKDVHNKLLLEEEVFDLKSRLEKFKDQEKKLNTLVVDHAQSEMYLEEFRALARAVCETSNFNSNLPRLLRSVIERLQQQELTLTSEKIQTDSLLSTATHDAKVAKDELEKSRSYIANLKKDLEQARIQNKRIYSKCQIVMGERDCYRKHLDAYEKDLSICINPSNPANAGLAQNQVQRQMEHIKQLESTIEEYKDMVHNLESDLRSLQSCSSGDNVPIRNEQLARLEKEVARMKYENDMLRERKDKLEIQLEEYLVGEDQSHGRMVHNTKNPLAEIIEQREHEKEKLQEEVANLKRKIKTLEDGLEASRIGELTVNFKEFQSMKEQLASSESTNTRLKEYFKEKLEEYRNVTYLLFGYKMDTTQNSRYKITSMYAESFENHLYFQLNKEGAFDLLENEYSASLEEMVELHLRHQGSIPVFLSALTLDLFKNETKTYEIDDDDDEDEENNANEREDDSPVRKAEEQDEEDDDDDDDDDESESNDGSDTE